MGNNIFNWVSSLNANEKSFEIYVNSHIIKYLYNKNIWKSLKMNLIFIIITISILTICFINYLINRRKRSIYLKAGKKWDGIVKELSKRR